VDTARRWNLAECSRWRLASFTLQVLGLSTLQAVARLPSYGRGRSHCLDIPHFLFPLDGHLGCFYFLAIVNMLLWTLVDMFSVSMGEHLGAELLLWWYSHLATVCLSFWETARRVSSEAVPFDISRRRVWGLQFLHTYAITSHCLFDHLYQQMSNVWKHWTLTSNNGITGRVLGLNQGMTGISAQKRPLRAVVSPCEHAVRTRKWSLDLWHLDLRLPSLSSANLYL
jgi:hypothetical protein